MIEEALTSVLLILSTHQLFRKITANLQYLIMQGFGLRLSPSQVGKPAFKEALMEVLTNPKYTVAAQAMSVKIRARKNTPVQEAAGVYSLLASQHSSSVGDLRHATPFGLYNPCPSLVNQILH